MRYSAFKKGTGGGSLFIHVGIKRVAGEVRKLFDVFDRDTARSCRQGFAEHQLVEVASKGVNINFALWCARYPSVADSSDHEARDQLMWGATLAGIAFGNSGTHLPHAMSYGVTHLMDNIVSDGYPVKSPFVPHGISVVVSAPAIFEYTAAAQPQRHLEGAAFLGADSKGATQDEAGEVLSKRLVELMRATHVPNGLSGVGFSNDDVKALAASSFRQQRAIANAPRESNLVDLENMYSAAVSYW